MRCLHRNRGDREFCSDFFQSVFSPFPSQPFFLFPPPPSPHTHTHMHTHTQNFALVVKIRCRGSFFFWKKRPESWEVWGKKEEKKGLFFCWRGSPNSRAYRDCKKDWVCCRPFISPRLLVRERRKEQERKKKHGGKKLFLLIIHSFITRPQHALKRIGRRASRCPRYCSSRWKTLHGPGWLV